MPLVVYFKLQIGDLAAKRVIKEQAASIFSFAKKWAYLKGPPPKKNKSVKWKSGIFHLRQTFKRPYVFVWFGVFSLRLPPAIHDFIFQLAFRCAFSYRSISFTTQRSTEKPLINSIGVCLSRL